MNRTMCVAMMSSVAIGVVASVGAPAQAARAEPARIMVVQALPGQTLDVEIDRRTVTEESESGSVMGPFPVTAGQHQVTFRDAGGEVLLETSVDVTSGSRQDLVVHLPAEAGGDPVATVYGTPTAPIGVDKARVLIAHTASVAPADVRVDGSVVFRNIANGEFATAEVPAGDHVAELLPSGLTGRPILGPLEVSLPAETVTMVYAVGDPTQDSMNVIAHSVPLSSNGADVPLNIDAGSAGLATGIAVTEFSTRAPVAGELSQGSHPLTSYAAALAALLALTFAIGFCSRSRSRPAVEALR